MNVSTPSTSHTQSPALRAEMSEPASPTPPSRVNAWSMASNGEAGGAAGDGGGDVGGLGEGGGGDGSGGDGGGGDGGEEGGQAMTTMAGRPQARAIFARRLPCAGRCIRGPPKPHLRNLKRSFCERVWLL